MLADSYLPYPCLVSVLGVVSCLLIIDAGVMISVVAATAIWGKVE